MAKIVEDGEARYFEANRNELEARREHIKAAVLERYQEELSKAGFWRRLVLRVRIKRDVRAACSSDTNLYLTEL